MSALIPLRAYLFRYKAALLGGFLFILAANIVALALPYLIRLAVDSLQTGVNTGLLLRYGLLIVVVDLLQMSHFVVSTPDLDSAYRIFSVLNDRGLDLTDLERLAAGLMVIR